MKIAQNRGYVHDYMDIGGRMNHDYRDIEGRVTPGAVTEETESRMYWLKIVPTFSTLPPSVAVVFRFCRTTPGREEVVNVRNTFSSKKPVMSNGENGNRKP